MDQHFDFLNMQFFTRASVYPGSIGTFRYRFQRTGWLNKPESTIQVWVYENISFAIAVKIITLILSAFGIAEMWLAIFADVGVMVIAVLNAMRILRK